jgi:tetratricopeptide (TPR) repeat protein
MNSIAVRAVTAFAEDLDRLRVAAGRPSLHQLVARSAGLARPLARSTISDKLTGKSVPDWDFVVSFVAACAAHAAAAGAPLDPQAAALETWDARHLHMLREVDAARRTDRLGAAAAAELARRTGAQRRPHDSPAEPTEGSAPGRAATVPGQLPAATLGFVGRTAELKRLDEVAGGDQPDGAVQIVAIDGTAGVGKTTLALHWAHRVAERFPDGSLYIELRGAHPAGSPVAVARALRAFLEAFGIPARRVPSAVEAQAGLYRSLTATRRLLVVLDNASDTDQVRPLLPGAPGSLVIVTSRNRLTGLITSHGAHPLTLGLLDAVESRQMLVRRLGAERVAGEGAEADAIALLCARLPLALAVVAARAATHPTFRLADLATELRQARRALDAFDTGEWDVDVRAAFSWSYQSLSPAAARMFRLLGVHPAGDITPDAAASIAGVPPDAARHALAELSRVHLIEEQSPGRHGHHALLRAYAAELGHAVDAEADRRAATLRAIDHYTQTAHVASALLAPHRTLPAFAPALPGVTVTCLADGAAALAWFIAERSALFEVIARAAADRFDTHAVHLAWVMFDFVNRQGHWTEWVDTQLVALDASRRTGDLAAEAYGQYALAFTYIRLDREADAVAHAERALALYARLGDHLGRANTHLNLGGLHERHRRYGEAVRHCEEALRLFEADGHRIGQARATNSLGWCHIQLGQYAEAIAHCRRALEVFHGLGEAEGEAATWDSLGLAYHRGAAYDEAADCFRTGVGLFREQGNRYGEAGSLTRLGDTYRARGDLAGARQAWHDALSILDGLGHADAADVRARLSG